MVNYSSLQGDYLELLDKLELSDATTKIRDFKFYVLMFFKRDPNIMPTIEEIIKDGGALGVTKYYWKRYDCIVYEVLMQPTVEPEITWTNRFYYLNSMIDFLEELCWRLGKCGGKK